MLSNTYLYKKVIDWSALHFGITIPISLQQQFYQKLKIKLKPGDNKKITLLVDGIYYDAILSNIFFKDEKYQNHKDLLQIRYTPNTPIAKKIRNIFLSSYEWLQHEKSKIENKGIMLKVPEDKREYIALYSTANDDVFLCECVTCDEIVSAKESIKVYDELDIENILDKQDDVSMIESKLQIAKIRKLDKSIGDSLKQFYKYKCQICGQSIGEKYDANVIHAHHIEYFIKSLNNNPNNIMIICPNHHYVIHNTNPVFDKSKKMFFYPNGYSEGILLNMHL